MGSGAEHASIYYFQALNKCRKRLIKYIWIL